MTSSFSVTTRPFMQAWWLSLLHRLAICRTKHTSLTPLTSLTSLTPYKWSLRNLSLYLYFYIFSSAACRNRTNNFYTELTLKKGKAATLCNLPFLHSHFTSTRFASTWAVYILHKPHATRGAQCSQCCRQNWYYNLNDWFPKFLVFHFFVGFRG